MKTEKRTERRGGRKHKTPKQISELAKNAVRRIEAISFNDVVAQRHPGSAGNVYSFEMDGIELWRMPVKLAARLLGVSPSTIVRAANKGRLVSLPFFVGFPRDSFFKDPLGRLQQRGRHWPHFTIVLSKSFVEDLQVLWHDDPALAQFRVNSILHCKNRMSIFDLVEEELQGKR